MTEKLWCEEWEMPCECCGAEDKSVRHVGPTQDRGMFLCFRCQNMEPEDRFKLMLAEARLKLL